MTKEIEVAHIVIEAKTPLKTGGSRSDFLQDSPVLRDWNGLPMILGTSIAGVLRSAYEAHYGDTKLFGYQEGETGEGSRVILSNALLLDEEGKVQESLLPKLEGFLALFETLPIREHVAISDKGVVDGRGKFDEEVVYAGTRFKFSIELIEAESDTFEKLLALFADTTFRLGGGGTKGFGSFEVVEVSYLKSALDGYSSSLNAPLEGAEKKQLETKNTTGIRYELKLHPDDFFMFGSGFGDEEADMTPVYEQVVDYASGGLGEKRVLIPASSIKGALAHRTVFHYNRIKGHYVGDAEAAKRLEALFGAAKNSKTGQSGSRGRVLFSDCYKSDAGSTKVFDHVSIDRFTGGAIEGALFQERTVADDGEAYTVEIHLDDKGLEEEALLAFEAAMKDVCTGMLPLGGAVTKGHGAFNGTVWKNGEAL